ncbi:hypothetical protein [Saccharopolyspora shandongensis]|uniref:hypothetical protein n=1 Tax=Saccharopolyspora shandongensis TaxID=418495 RepID=UPI003408F212
MAELRRIYEVAKRELLPFVEALPARKNPQGRFEELLGISQRELSAQAWLPRPRD